MGAGGGWDAMGYALGFISVFSILGIISSIVTIISYTQYLITSKENKNLKYRRGRVAIISCIIALGLFGLAYASPWIVEYLYRFGII